MLDERFNIDLAAVRSFLGKKEQVRSSMLDERFLQASCDFERICAMIIERFKPELIKQVLIHESLNQEFLMAMAS
jgi:hypothetical protein